MFGIARVNIGAQRRLGDIVAVTSQNSPLSALTKWVISIKMGDNALFRVILRIIFIKNRIPKTRSS